MRAQLKEMYSLQIPEMLKDFRPEASRNFGISIRLMIGPEGADQSESFDILVCTPTWIQDRLREEGCIWGRHMLITQEYDYKLILQSLSAYISSCTGKDWDEVANKVARIAAWEFEDYRPLN
ncbi:immunity 8 family protein [Burkholderia pseudomallei]|uniref:immunity 8 family protein n=1 Tax=Burkholderia pseudomallei TaxID=28450 RepID=UPI0007C7CDBA|nr:immunity 8 family protein [Burkholderia pseudomallei]